MRIYGMKSGKNNMSKLIARSYMYNSKNKNNTKAKQNNVSNTIEAEAFPTKVKLEDGVNTDAITVTVMNSIMDYSEG